MTQHSFKINDIPVGAEHPTVFFAEIGGFFNTDIDLATSMIQKVINASKVKKTIPVILKSEILDDAEICLPTDVMEPYADKQGNIKHENYRQIIERKLVSREAYSKLFKICRDANMPFILSVYDIKSADYALDEGVSALKIASSNVVHIPLIRHVAKMGIPMIIDTGRTSLDEATRAVETAREAGCNDIILQHSPDGHPALPEAHNLRIIQTYRNKFGIPVGLSDHSVNLEMMYMAIAMGANVIEKGVHINPDELDMDISHSMHFDDLPDTLIKLKDCWIALGKPERDLTQTIKGNIGTSQRQCLVAIDDMDIGEKISLQSVRFAFPRKPENIAVEDWDSVQGKQVSKLVKAGTALTKEDIIN